MQTARRAAASTQVCVGISGAQGEECHCVWHTIGVDYGTLHVCIKTDKQGHPNQHHDTGAHSPHGLTTLSGSTIPPPCAFPDPPTCPLLTLIFFGSICYT
jgi:hypothetical protein